MTEYVWSSKYTLNEYVKILNLDYQFIRSIINDFCIMQGDGQDPDFLFKDVIDTVRVGTRKDEKVRRTFISIINNTINEFSLRNYNVI